MKTQPDSQILNLIIPWILLLGILPIIRFTDLQPLFWVKMEVVFPPHERIANIELPPGETELTRGIYYTNLNVLVGPNYFYFHSYDSVLRYSANYISPIDESVLPKLQAYNKVQFLEKMAEWHADCPEYPIRFAMLPKASVGQFAEMMLLMRAYKVKRFTIGRIVEEEGCALEAFGNECTNCWEEGEPPWKAAQRIAGIRICCNYCF